MKNIFKILGLSLAVMLSANTMNAAGTGDCSGICLGTYSGRKLLAACDNNDIDAVRTLIANGTPIDDSGDIILGWTPLMAACRCGSLELVVLLLEHGAKAFVNAADRMWRETALMYAAENGHIAIVNLLLEIDELDLTLVNRNGKNAATLAIEHGHPSIAALIEQKIAKKKRAARRGYVRLEKPVTRSVTNKI